MNPLYLAMMQQQGQPPMPDSMPTAPLQLMPQQPSSSYANPFDSGITKAIEGARASIAASESQKAQALTASLSALAKAAASSQTPWGMSQGAGLGHLLAQAAPYAVDAYSNAEKQAEQENLGLADYMVKLKATQDDALRKALQEAWDRQHKMDSLEETKRHHGIQERKQDLLYQLQKHKAGLLSREDIRRQKEEETQRLEEEALARGETPLSVLEKPARAEYQKNALKTIRDKTTNNNNIKTIQKMRQLFKDNPGIGSNFVNLLISDKEGGFWNTLGRNVADKKKLAAAQELLKLTSSINFGTIMDVSGKTATNMMKQIIKDKGVHGQLEDKAFGNIADDLENQFRHKIDLAKKYEDGLRRKVMISDDVDTIPQESASSDLENVPTEDLLRELQALEGH